MEYLIYLIIALQVFIIFFLVEIYVQIKMVNYKWADTKTKTPNNAPYKTPNETSKRRRSLPPPAPEPCLPLYAPRLITLTKTANIRDYGIDLNDDWAGFYAYNVEANSPADVLGIKTYDRVIEVNGTNITSWELFRVEDELIHKYKFKVTLLVVSPEGFKYYNEQNIPITENMTENVETPINPETQRENTEVSSDETEEDEYDTILKKAAGSSAKRLHKMLKKHKYRNKALRVIYRPERSSNQGQMPGHLLSKTSPGLPKGSEAYLENTIKK